MKKIFLLLIFIIFDIHFLNGCGSGNKSDQLSMVTIATHPISQIVTDGQSVTLSVIVNGQAPFHFQWKKENTSVGTDSSKFTIETARTVNAGAYSVIVSNAYGEVTSNPAILAVTPVELSDRSFTFAVWLQNPETIINGKTNAQNYKNIGINTFLGLWNWPSEVDMYPGYAKASMQALKDEGLHVYTENYQATINWINDNTEFSDTLVGYLLGDEPDMSKVNNVPGFQPDEWRNLGNAIRTADPTRAIYANFGKGFALDPWPGYLIGPGPTQADDFAKYVDPLSVLSSDYYGITDPWESPNNHGIWTYGRAVKNTLKFGSPRQVWGFLEASAPWGDASSNNWMFQRMPPSFIMPIVWNMIISGAQGIIYFCHDFSPGISNKGSSAALLEQGIPEAMKAANESVMAFGTILKSASVTSTSVSTNGKIQVIVLTKKHNGDTYIFAMGNGNSNYRDGLAIDAEITVAGETGSKTVTVLNDLRNVIMSNGKIKDHFDPYELHIYKIDN